MVIYMHYAFAHMYPLLSSRVAVGHLGISLSPVLGTKRHLGCVSWTDLMALWAPRLALQQLDRHPLCVPLRSSDEAKPEGDIRIPVRKFQQIKK